jgi:hypothetical protein
MAADLPDRLGFNRTALALDQTGPAGSAVLQVSENRPVFSINIPHTLRAKFCTAAAPDTAIAIIGEPPGFTQKFRANTSGKRKIANGSNSQSRKERIQIASHGGGDTPELCTKNEQHYHCHNYIRPPYGKARLIKHFRSSQKSTQNNFRQDYLRQTAFSRQPGAGKKEKQKSRDADQQIA